MAERPSVKEILAAVRRAGPAQTESAPLSQAEREAGPPAQDAAELADLSAAPEPPELAPAPPPNVPTPSALGRPLTLKEKLAAARAGGAARPAAAPAAPPPVTPDLPPAAEAVPAEEAAPAPAAPPPDVPTPSALGRPLTLKEKLAAARAGSGGASAAPTPAGAKPAAKAAAAAPAARPAAAARVLPPLEKMTDPRDLAEALRRAGAERQKAAGPKAEPAKAKHAAKPKAVPPRPARDASLAAAQAQRRSFLQLPWVAIGWSAFAAGTAAFTAMLGRFMFPNVLAEPPSTIKVGLPSNFEKEEVNENWKAEWGFWIVRSAAYNGQDMIYAIQSVCTHLGCPPNWLAGEQKFKCPCHGSGFYISGINFEGPAPRPLERFKISVGDDGNIVVDKSQKYQEELGQWADPDSFLPV